MNIFKTIENRSGFTLIELLLVIAMIAILSSLALVVVRGAQDEAKRAATLSRINQIRTLLLDRFEDYETRKIPVDLNGYGLSPSEQRQIGQRIIADLMLTEMPVPSSDNMGTVIAPVLVEYPSQAFQDWIRDFEFQLNNADPSRNLVFYVNVITNLRQSPIGQPPVLPNMVERVRVNSSPGNPPFSWNTPDLRFDLAGEFLFEILRTTDRDGQSGIEILTNRAVSDIDLDGIPEVSDAWNEPIGMQFTFVEPNLPNGAESLPDAIRDLTNISFLEINNIRIQLFSNKLY